MHGPILVVDDDRVSRLVLRHMLSQLGHASIECWDVASAKEALTNDQPDVVICDLLLPDGNGLDVLEYLQTQNIAAEFILLSGVTAKSEADDPRIDGVLTYLTKPVSTAELAATLAHV